MNKVSPNKSQLKDFDSFWNDAEVLSNSKTFDDIKSNIFHVNRDTFMKETKPTKLKKIKGRAVFLDTVVFGKII